MNLTQFQTLSKRTMPFGGEPQNNQEFENMLGNYAMGLVGEFLELEEAIQHNEPSEEIIKEFGDILHYAVGILSCLGETVNNEKAKLSSREGKYLAGNICESVKKHLYHRHDIEKELIIQRVYGIICAIQYGTNFNFKEIMHMNIDKLKTRYPDKFSVEDSIARVDTK